MHAGVPTSPCAKAHDLQRALLRRRAQEDKRVVHGGPEHMLAAPLAISPLLLRTHCARSAAKPM